MPFRNALLNNSHVPATIVNPLPGLEWALVVNRHVQAEKAAEGSPPEVEYQRDITDEGIANVALRRRIILDLGFDDKPTAIMGSPAKRCWKTAHGCGGLPFDHPDPNLFIPIKEWGWAKGWPEDSKSDDFYALLNANKDKPVRFFLNFHGFPGFAQYLIPHAEVAWSETLANIEEAGGGLFFASGHSPTQDKMCHAAVRTDVHLAHRVLDTHIGYGQGWWIGSPDGEQVRFGWMLQ